MADLIVILILACVFVLIIRSMRHGGVQRCEGTCDSCSHACSKTGIRLTDEQQARLASLDELRRSKA